MASSFSEIIKMAKAHSDDTKREALEATKRREASIRQAREEQDKKERAEKELQKKLMMKRMEDAKLEEERKKQREGELAKRREEIAKRKGEEKDDPRTSRPGRSSGSGSGSGSARLKYVNTTSTALTREEKRMVKDPLFTESLGKGKGKAAAIKKLRNGHLPGGALPIVENGSGSSSARKGASGSAQSMTARARMSAGFAPTLTRLNTEKRDQRSIDEISRDLKRGKLGPSTAEEKAAPPALPSTLSGTQASSFGDWFGKKKDKELESQKTNMNGKAKPTSLASPIGNKSRPHPPPPVPSSSKPSVARRDSLQVSSKGKMPATSSSSQQSRKRSRGSSELDDSDSYDSDDRYGHRDRHPAKRSAPFRGDDDLGGDVRDLIWGLMGKNRKQYTSIDVESDDDMEVTGAELEKEEMLSARLARKEDAEAEAEERRREMEKKRRKVERDKVRKEL